MDNKKSLPVYNFLPTGRANAVPLQLIMARFGLSSREARKQIERERAAGALILSTSEGTGGYWRGQDAGELEKFSASMTHRARRILRTALLAEKAARKAREAAYTAAAQGGGECLKQKTDSGTT